MRLLHAPPPLATRGFTRRRSQHPETKGFDLLSSSLPLPADYEECRHLQSQESTTNNQINFLSFLDLLPLVFFLPIWIYFTADRLLYKQMMALSSGVFVVGLQRRRDMARGRQFLLGHLYLGYC